VTDRGLEGAASPRPLTVAIDGRELDPGAASTGVGRYLRCLITALQRDPALTVRVAAARRPRLLGPHVLMPLQMRRQRADVLHGPANGLPLLRFGVPGVVTIHDVAIYDHPEWFPERQWISTRLLVPRAATDARIVICPSEATRRGVMHHLGAPADRCRVIPHGVEPAWSTEVDPAGRDLVRRRLNLPDRYWLQVGTVQPRKNYGTTLRALARIPPRDRIPLIVVGAMGWKYEPVIGAIRELGLGNDVRLVGSLEIGDLPAVYQMAEALAFPSYDEGFGLPVLEGFAAELSVVAARRGAILEFADGAALLIEPDDDAALAEALMSLRRDAGLRDRQIAAGRQRARAFTWEASAAAHALAYRAAAG
jgi:glycosyltransferase involved in cell wall biosynthesis